MPLANFFASGVLALREKLGPILWQFPPNFGWNETRFREFFELLPRDTEEAAQLARLHDEKLKTKPWLRDGANVGRCVTRWRFGIRPFSRPRFSNFCANTRAAFVFADTAGKWPYAEELTTDLVYIRLHGDTQLYVSGYSDSRARLVGGTHPALAARPRRLRLFR